MVAPGSRRPRGAKLCPWTPWGLWGVLAPARRGARCRRRGMAAPGAAAMRPHSGAKSVPRRQAVPPFPGGPAGRFGAHKGRRAPWSDGLRAPGGPAGGPPRSPFMGV